MWGKADWNTHLHMTRRREVEILLGYVGERRFRHGIEFGAGDGFQTTLLAPRCERYVSSDLNFKRFKESLKVPGVEYRICDADRLGGVFTEGEFDFVFSSSMLEHLSRPEDFLLNTHRALSSGGIAVHIVPSRFLKIMYLFLFYPHLFLLALDRIAGLFSGKKVFRGGGVSLENNLNPVAHKPRGRWRKLLLPQVHGNFHSHWAEYKGFGTRRWERLFEAAGFLLEARIKGPVFSGYGFGWDRLRGTLEQAGICSEHIFILRRP